MLAIKSAKQNYNPNEEILSLLEEFRCMVNDCIRVGLRENVTSMKSLSAKAYHELSAYDTVPTCYRLTAISRAAGILRNYRKALRENPKVRIPYVKRLSLIDCYGFRIFGRLLRLPLRRGGEYVFVILNEHTMKMVSEHEVRSVTLTEGALSIAYSKDVAEIERKGLIGIDRNMGNVTMATTSNGAVKRIDLSETVRLKGVYREIKSHFNRNDVRIRRKILSKYGRRQRDRVNQVLQRATKEIIGMAKRENLGIVLENLKGIRKLGRRGNWQGRRARFRINSWSVYELGRQLEYKARWEGIPVFYVPASGTTMKCSMCGKRTREFPNEHRTLRCEACDLSIDRDENGAKNTLAKGLLRFGSHGPPVEAMRRNPEGRRRQAIRGADGGKVALGINTP